MILPKNVWILTAAQACLMSSAPLVVFVGGILGAELAPVDELATLPVASIVIGGAISTVPIALSMRRFGRKKIFLSIAILSILACLLTALAIFWQSFYLLCTSFLISGVGMSSVQQFRFAAMESVSDDLIPKAASTVLLGGIAAAFIGPEIAEYGRYITNHNFLGSMLLLACVLFIGTILLIFYENTVATHAYRSSGGRSLGVVVRQPVFWVAALSAMVGYSVMSFIMTATPVSMHVMDGHSVYHTKWVIQSHIMAMYFPSFFSGYFISKLGVYRMMVIGVALFALCISVALVGQNISHYWISLAFLGVGWNFLFVGGTALLPQAYETNERFKVQALNEFMVFGSQAFAALSAGYFVFNYGWKTIQFTCIPLLLIPLIAIFYIKALKT